VNTIRVEIDRELAGIKLPDWPPADYMAYHFGLHKGLVKQLVPRIGIDIIFIYRKPTFRSALKQMDRFWHNYRKTVTKSQYYKVKERVQQILISSYEEGLAWMEYYEESNKAIADNVPMWDFRGLPR